jgi:hypothetical protein
MLSVINAEYVSDYKILVEFNNSSKGIIDLSDSLWGPVFNKLKDINEFKKFKISSVFGTIVWENNADFAPEFLHDILISQNKSAA